MVSFLGDGSPAFEAFMQQLAERVPLRGWSKFSGGLDTVGTLPPPPASLPRALPLPFPAAPSPRSPCPALPPLASSPLARVFCSRLEGLAFVVHTARALRNDVPRLHRTALLPSRPASGPRDIYSTSSAFPSL